MLTYLSQCGFKSRVVKVTLPPANGLKTSFDYHHTEPVKNWEKAVINNGSSFDKHTTLDEHYETQEFRNSKDHDDSFPMMTFGLYGPYWTAHYGGGYIKFLKRRSTDEAIYNHKYPWVNWWRRKLDERAIHWEFPRGQDYQIILKMLLQVYLFVFILGQISNMKAHFNNKKPLPPPDTYPPRINLPFYVYITHDLAAPNLE